MEIKINDKEFSKEELIALIKKNKLQAIIHVRNIVNIGLKDAKEIVENLDSDPNYYDNVVVEKEHRFPVLGEKVGIGLRNENEEATQPVTRERKVGSHIIKTDNSTNSIWIFALFIILVGTVLYFLM